MTAELGSRWPLVGRDPERHLLSETIAAGDRGLVIAGFSGVGKTRLASECADEAARKGWAVARLVATSSASEVPLGALFKFLTSSEAGAAPDASHTVVEQLQRIGGGGRLLVVVDDAQHLDTTSAAVLAQVAVSESVVLVLTIRSGHPVPEPLTMLWKDEHARRIDLEPLDRRATEDLVRRVLDGHVAGATVQRMWEITLGNPLYLRELIIGAVDSGVLDQVDGVWVMNAFPPSPRLTELVDARLAEITDDERDLLEHLAVAEPLTLELAERLVDPNTVDRLDRAGLVRTDHLDGPAELFFGHPVHGEVLRSQITPLRVRSINRTLARASVGLSDIDPLRTALWHLDSGTALDPVDLLAAARSAHFADDDHLAERLARSALDAGGGPAAAMVLGEALVGLGSFADAEVVLAAAASSVTSDRERAMVAMNRAQGLLWGLGRPRAAEDVLAEVVGCLEPGPWLDEVLGMRAVNLLLGGRPLDAAAAATPLLDRPEGRVRVEAATVIAPALAVGGRTSDAIAVATRAYSDCVELGDQFAMADPRLHLLARSLAELEGGELLRATATAQRAYDDAMGRQSADGQAWAALMLSLTSLSAGQLRDADRYGAEGAMLFRSVGQTGTARWCLAARAWALAYLGEGSAAGELLVELDGLPRDLLMMEVDVLRARAWCSVATDGARTISELVAAGMLGMETGALSLAAGAFHDLVRIGEAPRALEPLLELAEQVDGRVMGPRVAHAMAAVDGSGADLERVGVEFEALGFVPLAAEVLAQASCAWRASGSMRDSTRTAMRARVLADSCGGLTTPALALAGPTAALTSREREVCGRAAVGRSNKEIAMELGLSVRTVENHLQRSFEKLGVPGRRELAEVLTLTRPE